MTFHQNGLTVLRRFPQGAGPEQSAHLYYEMFENAVWGIFQTTLDGHYLAANPALARIYGYDTPQTLLAVLTDIANQLYVEPGRRAEFVRLIQEQGTLSGFESQVYRQDGRIIWISESCRAVRAADGTLLFYEGTVEDVTARKQAEFELQQARLEAEAGSRAKSAFLAQVSHELRTPLNAVLGFAQLIGEGTLGDMPDGYRDYAGMILSSGSRLLDIVNDLLDASAAEGEGLELNPEPVALDGLVAACAAHLADRAWSRGVRLRTQLPFAPPPPVEVDRKRLRQALLNLMTNAVEFSADGGTVTVSVEVALGGGTTLAVSDEGPGMTEVEQAQALEPFRQVDGSLSRRHGGLGLGLPIARAIVEAHGGRLMLRSAPGAGTTATIHLPPKSPPRTRPSLSLHK